MSETTPNPSFRLFPPEAVIEAGARYQSSDRQARGAVLAELRAGRGVPIAEVIASWPDPLQR